MVQVQYLLQSQTRHNLVSTDHLGSLTRKRTPKVSVYRFKVILKILFSESDLLVRKSSLSVRKPYYLPGLSQKFSLLQRPFTCNNLQINILSYLLFFTFWWSVNDTKILVHYLHSLSDTISRVVCFYSSNQTNMEGTRRVLSYPFFDQTFRNFSFITPLHHTRSNISSSLQFPYILSFHSCNFVYTQTPSLLNLSKHLISFVGDLFLISTWSPFSNNN